MKKAIVTLTILVGIFMFTGSFAYDDGDFQFWNTESFEGVLGAKYKINVEEEFRLGDASTEFYYQHSDLGVSYSLTKWFSVSANYRHIYELKSEEWTVESKPHVNGVFGWGFYGFDFKNRSRVAYRVIEEKDNIACLENKLDVKYPIKWEKIEVVPYIADEIFVNFDSDNFNRNRIFVGIATKFYKRFTTDIYYLLQTSKKETDWQDTNILGLRLNIAI